MSELRFASEPFTLGLLAEMMPLLQRHWTEIGHYADIPLDVDDAVYRAAARSGALRVYTARAASAHTRVVRALTGYGQVRTEAGELVGYAVFFVRGNPHYASSLQAVQDVLFIAPEHRGVGMRFVAWCDLQLQGEGVQAVYHHVKAAHNWGRALERQGYELVDLIYAKRLDRQAPVHTSGERGQGAAHDDTLVEDAR